MKAKTQRETKVMENYGRLGTFLNIKYLKNEANEEFII